MVIQALSQSFAEGTPNAMPQEEMTAAGPTSSHVRTGLGFHLEDAREWKLEGDVCKEKCGIPEGATVAETGTGRPMR